MNLRNVIFGVIVASLCVNTFAFKRRGKAKIKKSNTINLPGCGCQNPLFNIIDCGCKNPVIDASYALTSYDIPCGCQNPVLDIPKYRYVDTVEISALGYMNPLEMSNYACIAPSIEYITPYELPCGCQGPKCGCRGPVKVPAYPYGALTQIEVPNCGCQELRPGYAAMSPIIEIAGLSPVIQVPGCGCLGSCGCQNIMACGCSGAVCGCQSPMSCGCPGPICGCHSAMSCGCPGPVCGCQSPLPCGCQGPLCGCQTLSCGCPASMCGCQSFEAPLCGCGRGFPGCQCGGKYLRQITLQPPFL